MGNRIEPGTISERGRSVPMGEWIAVAFSAANFVSDNPGVSTWTVESGDVASNRYMLIGKTLWWSLRVGSTSVTNIFGLPAELRITIPGGFTAAFTTSVATAYLNDNGTTRDSLVEGIGGQTYVAVKLRDGSTFAASANATYVYFLIAIEVS